MCDVRCVMCEVRRKKGQSLFSVALLLMLAVLSGCQHEPRMTPHAKMRAGMYEEARDLVESQVIDDRSDRRYMLDRMRAGVLNLDAGDPQRAERWFAEVYDVLRTQGLNADKTVSSVVLTEGVKVWKGEPFEQAMALVYYGFVQASLGSWDNARAAAGNALFYLRDFESDKDGDAAASEGGEGQRIDTAEIARRAAEYEARQRGETPEGQAEGDFKSGDEYLDHGYVAESNNFTMAYLLHGIASQQLGRDDEASDYYKRVLELNPQLRPLVQQLRSGQYNTIVVVADGLGPRKVATGPNNVLSRYQPIDAQRSPAVLQYAGMDAQQLPAVTDVNQMALDHRWNNLEDVRIAKNVLGDLALVGGSVVLFEGARQKDATLAIIGAGVLAAGVFMKATSQANTDYCDVFPQRLFVAALNVTEPNHELVVDMPGPPPSFSARLKNLEPPVGPGAKFYYLRTPVDRDLNPRPRSVTDPSASNLPIVVPSTPDEGRQP